MSELRSFALGTSALSVALLVAVVLTCIRRPRWRLEDQRRVNRLVAVGLLVHVLHVVEEWLTGFHVLFPRRMDLTPWPTAVFLGFNLAWLITWSACIPALRARCRLALAPLWFLGLGAAINGVAHPALAWLAGGYFPGLISAPLVGVLGVLLLRALATATADLSEPGPLPA